MDKELKIYLGVDWGSKRIGLSLGDSETRLATPFKTVSGAHDLAETAREENADVLVIGEPIKMRGIKEGLAKDFLEFAAELKNRLPDMEIIFIDERLSSKAADALPGGNLKASRDEVAAMILLQEYLDKMLNAKC
ncbi:MAG: Holliday junction resolvase RuvX [Patescibacteria group bacterium]|nr:Holliday junction resolvase RuvX [Patescibacteria group bacterium]